MPIEAEFENLLKTAGWKFLGRDGIETAYELPDQYVCSFTETGIWRIEFQWVISEKLLATDKGLETLRDFLQTLN